MAGVQRPTQNLLRVLKVLLAAYEKREALYGIEVARRAGVTTAAAYPMLDRLQLEAWVEADWEPPTCPARDRHPLYQLTPAGVVAARRFQAEGRGWFLRERRAAEPGGGPTP